MKCFKNFITENITDANIFLCSISQDNAINSEFNCDKSLSIIRELSNDLSIYNMDAKSIKNSVIYDCGNFSGNSINNVISKLQFDFFKHEGFHLIFGCNNYSKIVGERAFYSKCLKNNKIPVIIHLDSRLNFYQKYGGNYLDGLSSTYSAIKYGYLPKNIVILGARVFSDEEMINLGKYPEIDVFKINDIRNASIDNVITYLSKKYSSKQYEIYLSYNLNINDPSEAPFSLNRDQYGLYKNESLKLLTELISRLNIDTLEIMGINEIDYENKKSIYNLTHNNKQYTFNLNNYTTTKLALSTLKEIFFVLNNK